MADAVNNTDEAPKKEPVTPPELKEAVGITPGGLESAAATATPVNAQATPTTEGEKPAEADPKAQNAKAPEENEDEKARKKRLKEQQEQLDAAVNDEQGAKNSTKKPEEQNVAEAAPPKQQQTAPAQEEEQQQSRFVKLGRKDFDVLHKHPHWNTPNIDPNLHEVMDQGRIRKAGSGINFQLNNAHTIQWRPDLGKSATSPGTEFVGVRTGSFTRKFDENDAKAVVAIGKMRGWNSLRVHGTIQQKDMMWIEAQRQGIPVKGYEPTPEMAAKWAKEAEERAQKESDKHLTGGTDGDKPIPTLTEDEKKGIEKEEPKTPKAKEPEQKSNFVVGATGKPKKIDELSKMARAPFKAGPKEDETVDQYLDRKIATSKNSDVKQGFLQIKAALNNGELQMGEIDMTKLLRDEVSGKSVAEELKSVRKVVGGLGVTINDSIEKVDLAAAAPETPKKVAPAAKAGGLGMS